MTCWDGIPVAKIIEQRLNGTVLVEFRDGRVCVVEASRFHVEGKIHA